MAINVSQAFKRTSKNPIDETMALTQVQMRSVNDNTMPDRYFTICQDDGAIYLYSKANTADPTTGKFRKFEGGSDVKSVYYGYLKEADGKFYADSAYTTEIAGAEDTLYVTKDTDKTYRYDSTNGFVLVGGGDGETIQYDTMPTASSALVGTIVQYVGSTTATYTKGYWYECVLDGSTYKWQNIQVQEGGGESGSGISVTATLLAASWDAQNQQTVTFTGYQASMNGVIGVPASATDAQKEAYASALVRTVSQNGNQFTFECESIPSIDLPVTIYAGGSSGGGADALDDLTDVDLSSPAEGDLLQRNGNGEWVNSAAVPNALAAVRDNGSVNELLFPYANDSQVIQGITWTVNSKGKVKANGTANPSSNSNFYLTPSTFANGIKISKPMYLTGAPAGGGNYSYTIIVDRYDSQGTPLSGLSGTKILLDDTSLVYCIRLFVYKNTTVDNIEFWPMLSDARLNLSYADYQPYSMTNRELTENRILFDSTDKQSDSNGQITYTNMPVDNYSQIHIVGYRDSNTGGNRFFYIVSTAIKGYGDINDQISISNTIRRILLNLTTNQLTLTFVEIDGTKMQDVHIKEVYLVR